MTTRQLNKLTMYLAVEGICDATPTAWESLPAFADAYDDLNIRINNIQAFAQSQELNQTGVAQDKQAARKAMCAMALPIAQAIHAFAVKTKNHTLAEAMDFSMSDLMAGRDIISRDKCQNIIVSANENLASLSDFGVTAGKLTAVSHAINAYILLISKPRDTRSAGRTVTNSLPAEFAAADEDLVIMDDLTGQLTVAKFVSDYKNARTIVDTPASHASPPPKPPKAPKPPTA